MDEPSGVLLVLTNCSAKGSATRIRQEVCQCPPGRAAQISWAGSFDLPLAGARSGSLRGRAVDQDDSRAVFELEALIRRLHPYALPEIVAIPIERGCPDYLAWVAHGDPRR